MGAIPVIVLDMHQHAYYRDYLDNPRGYVVSMMRELNWNVINERFKRIDLVERALRAV
jgi:Fe-Mn family superoxide dismutase